MGRLSACCMEDGWDVLYEEGLSEAADIVLDRKRPVSAQIMIEIKKSMN